MWNNKHTRIKDTTEKQSLFFNLSTMKTSAAIALILLVGASAFSQPSLSTSRSSNLVVYGYVPAGFTPEQYKVFKAEEAKKKAKANLGGVGPRGFKSRSMQSFQEAMERGEAGHLLPVFNAADRIKKGELKKEDIPYMQRGGSWDNSDVKGAKQKKWLSSDKSYSGGGFKKEQSVSVFGFGAGLDWSGKRGRTGPESALGEAPKFAKNYKAPNVKQFKKKNVKDDKGDEKKKGGLFGMF